MATTLHTSAHDAKITSPWDGWEATGETWTYASSDDPTYTITVPSDATTKYWPGMRVKLTDSGTQYFVITKVATTVLTVYGGSDYNLSTGTITNPYFSSAKAPYGFPLDPDKWTQKTETAAAGESSPGAGTWYNHGGSLTVPIGLWWVSYESNLYGYTSNSGEQYISSSTLSTANNSESDNNWTVQQVWRTLVGGTTEDQQHGTGVYKRAIMSLTTSDVFYLNCSAATAINAVGFMGSGTPSKIKAVCAYL